MVIFDCSKETHFSSEYVNDTYITLNAIGQILPFICAGIQQVVVPVVTVSNADCSGKSAVTPNRFLELLVLVGSWW